MKYVLLIFLNIACSPSYEHKPNYAFPPELEDCKVFTISDGSKLLYVVRCPNSEVTTSWNRSCGNKCATTEHLQTVMK
jgi:hypothetical protein